MPFSATAVEDFVVIGVQPDTIQIKSADGETLSLSAGDLSEVFDSVVRLTFRADPTGDANLTAVPIVLNAIVTRNSAGQRQRVEVFQLKLARG
ncbi:MAG: hypothetical protein HYV17_11370 [Xanthomonadales bacterium]|nr:hypothetical protein [Xanthomonadales bacterium]